MGVYIKGMEMPKAGQIIEIAEGIEGTIYARLSPGFDEWHSVVPVPPHGRMIDGDVLSKMFDPDESFGTAVLEIIADTPTIIQAEEGE